MALEQQETTCREDGCDLLATTEGYCRAHYIKNWEKIKEKRALLQTGQLQRFVRDFVDRYPAEVVRAIRHDLASEEAFLVACRDLGFDETFEEVAAESDASSIEEAFVFKSEKPESEEGEGGEGGMAA